MNYKKLNEYIELQNQYYNRDLLPLSNIIIDNEIIDKLEELTIQNIKISLDDTYNLYHKEICEDYKGCNCQICDTVKECTGCCILNEIADSIVDRSEIENIIYESIDNIVVDSDNKIVHMIYDNKSGQIKEY